MTRNVALLRGINLGPNKRLAMTDLKAILQQLGYAEVRTYLQSGNAVFRSSADQARLEEEIEAAVRSRTGMALRCLVRSAAEIDSVVAGNPFGSVATDGSRLLVLFLSEPLDPDQLRSHDPRALSPETIRLGERVIYQWCPDGFLAAPAVGTFVEKRYKLAVTARNWNTVARLAALLAE